MNDTTAQLPEQTEPAGYPASWEFDGLLNDGEAVLVRPVRPNDATALAGLHVHTPLTRTRHSLRASYATAPRWTTKSAWPSWSWPAIRWWRSRALID
jgi:hypothetical protein